MTTETTPIFDRLIRQAEHQEAVRLLGLQPPRPAGTSARPQREKPKTEGTLRRLLSGGGH